MDKPKFTYVAYIKTTPEKLWTALTSSDFTQQYWWGRRIESDWQKGSPIKIIMENGQIDLQGELLQVEKLKVISYTFEVKWKEEFSKEPPSRVTYEIKPQGAVVRLTVTHDEFESGSKLYEGVSEGWPTILSGLKTLLETGEPLFIGKDDSPC